ncbi:MAG TPA: MBL fold metallo-hydrolase, partial [Pirellulaceae bacterium]|nr:MBL fold metallo-hydrolase [Pirellulaceae bacterium]
PLLGRHFDPVIGVRRWRRTVKSKIAALESWASAEKPEARIYLDGQPKQLAPRLYYLGEHEGTAGYVVDAGSGGLVCVDPAGRDRKSLDETLAKLDLKSTDVKTVLLTGVHPSHSAGARALCDSLSAQLWCGPVSQSAPARERLKPDRELKPSSDIELGDVKIRVLAGVRAAGADLCYVVKTEKHLALLGGDSVLRFPKPQRDVHPELDEATVIDPELSLLSIEAVMSLPIDLLLPAHPRLEQSPLFLPGEWQERFKRR